MRVAFADTRKPKSDGKEKNVFCEAEHTAAKWIYSLCDMWAGSALHCLARRI